MFSVVTRVRGEVRAGALPSEDRNPAGGPLVDPPSRVFAFHGVHAMSASQMGGGRDFIKISMISYFV